MRSGGGLQQRHAAGQYRQRCGSVTDCRWPHRSGARQDETVKSLGLSDSIEDILMPLGKPHPILDPAEKINGLFIYYVLDRGRANRVRRRRR